MMKPRALARDYIGNERSRARFFQLSREFPRKLQQPRIVAIAIARREQQQSAMTLA